jgi:hypothetical protein
MLKALQILLPIFVTMGLGYLRRSGPIKLNHKLRFIRRGTIVLRPFMAQVWSKLYSFFLSLCLGEIGCRVAVQVSQIEVVAASLPHHVAA